MKSENGTSRRSLARRRTHIIIGTSAAGLSAARTLARLDKESHIICLSQEQEQPYNKCFLGRLSFW